MLRPSSLRVRNKSQSKHQRRPRFQPRVDELEAREMLSAAQLVVGPDAGDQPRIKVYNASNGGVLLNFLAFESTFTGGVRVATGDVTGDGVADIIAGKGPGGGSTVRVFNGVNGHPLSGTLGSFSAYGTGETSGVYVAAGDVNGDGKADIITGTEQGAAPLVKIFSGVDGSLITSFTVGSGTTGVRVAAGDVNGDGLADIVTGEGPGGVPRVCVFDGSNRAELFNFYAYEYSFGGGIYVSASDITGDGKADIVVGPGAGRAPEVRAFHGADTAYLAKFLSFDSTFTSGVRVATVDADGDGKADIAAAQAAPGNQVRIFNGHDQSLLRTIKPYGNNFDDGSFVGGPTSGGGGVIILDGQPTVTVGAMSPNASEPSTNGSFVFTRAWPDVSYPLTVNYSVAGIATSGVDYTALTGSVTIAANQTMSSAVNVAVIDDSAIEGTETVIVTVEPGSGYVIGNPSSATVSIGDNETGQGSQAPADMPDETICPPDKLDVNSGLARRTVGAFSEGPIRYFDGTVKFTNA